MSLILETIVSLRFKMLETMPVSITKVDAINKSEPWLLFN
jgi:hypothetical protein